MTLVGKICARCAYWLRYPVGSDGRCRRHPPTVLQGGYSWPVTGPTDVCGEFQPDDNQPEATS